MQVSVRSSIKQLTGIFSLNTNFTITENKLSRLNEYYIHFNKHNI